MFDQDVKLLQNILQPVTIVKANVWLVSEFTKIIGKMWAFKIKNVPFLRNSNLEKACGTILQNLFEDKEVYVIKGSG